MITYKQGHLLEQVRAHAIIFNPCNNLGRFGHGFAHKVGLAYPIVRESFVTRFSHELGDIECIKVTNNLIIVNGVFLQLTEDGYKISYNHLEKCLDSLLNFAKMLDKPIHLPRIIDKDDRAMQLVERRLSTCTVWLTPDVNKNTNFKFPCASSIDLSSLTRKI